MLHLFTSITFCLLMFAETFGMDVDDLLQIILEYKILIDDPILSLV